MRARVALAGAAALVTAMVAPAPLAGAAPVNQAITIFNTRYMPSNVTIVTGTVVTWTNDESSRPHSVTSDTGVFDSSPTNCGSGGGYSGCIQPNGGTYQYTFNTAGTFAYHCRVHASMHATVQVLLYRPGVRVVGASPRAIPPTHGIKVTFTGQGFASGATVSFSGAGVTAGPTTLMNAQTMTATVAVAASAAPGRRDVTVTDPGGGGSGTCTGCLTVDAPPAPTSVSPSSEPQGTSGASVTVNGTGFVRGATVVIPGGANVTSIVFVSSTRLKLTVDVPTTAPLGVYTVSVNNPDRGSGRCRCFTVTASSVTVTGVSPGAIGAGASRVVTVTGGGFETGATVSVSGGYVSAGPTSVQNSSTLTVTISADTLNIYGPRDLTVTNPAGGGAGSCVGCLTVDRVPNPVSASPNSLPRGTSNATITLNGTDFQSGAVASSPNETGIVDVTSTTFVSSTQLTLTVTVASNAPTGPYDIEVVNPDAGAGTRVGCLTVT